LPDSHGVEEDFRDFVATRSGALLRTAYLLAGDWATAEDLLQIALTKTYLAWKRLGRIDAIEPYTRKVLVNTATSWWRRRWHGERPTEVLPETAITDGLEERLEREALWRQVRDLPARQRAVLVLRFYEDQSEAETARLLGVSVGTVKSQCSRALASLRQRLGEQGIEPAQKKRDAVRIFDATTVELEIVEPADTADTAEMVEMVDLIGVVDLDDVKAESDLDEVNDAEVLAGVEQGQAS
jgi:RNA polymerase sigma-70 factor (sigma-E family)